MRKGRTIHVVVKYFYPVLAGIELNVFEISKQLVKKGWKVEVHTSKNTLTNSGSLRSREKINGIHVNRYKTHLWGFVPKFSPGTGDIVSLHNFNVFPHLFILSITYFLTLLRRKNYHLVLTPHSGFTPQWTSIPVIPRIIKYLYHCSLGLFLVNRCVDGVRAISEWERQELVIRGVKKDLIKVITNGLGQEAYKNRRLPIKTILGKKITMESDYIVQVGRIHPIKNQIAAVEALAKMEGNLNLVFIGTKQDAQYEYRIKRLINEYNLSNRIEFLSDVSEKEKFTLLRQAKAMVHMAYHEGFCNAVYEGLSQGLPVICSNQTALPYLVKDGINGYCVDPNDYRGVASKLNYLLDRKNIQKIREMRKVNQKSFSKSWTATGNGVHQLFLQL